ncbi:MerR family transcriptional regulator [Companilactobacillus alimentarius]|uniref:MerR family transcriptional regulator n=1 Tax=Companilactobacillus alimentarius DSM 20249 TaxID=1423720 RepID=A0A2K9HJV5_9LACO|nr:MerR family transcriptional regulator [Companilactobacillus alimentarius]AUI72810.1 MerR family transcriptional regulator [Companilactobacillus alimentarius DSM 20249]MDT6952392.1 MerR family transcriptional regulator [Companilactobacillus alimentarius]
MVTTYSIGEVSEQFGLSLPTIRYYDKEGLIPNLNKNEAGVRRFTEENIGSLKLVECLKNAGMPIKDIKQFVQWTKEGDDTLDERLQMFQELKTSVQNQMQKMQETLDVINFKCAYYDKATTDGTEEYAKKEMHL